MYQTLKGILVNDLRLAEVGLAPDAAIEDAGLDSLGLVELSMVLSERLGIDITDDELLAVGTVGEIATLMEERSRLCPVNVPAS